jgi:hypothetical protein
MPAAAGTAFNWVFVRSGIWTKIAGGPLVTGLLFQGLELATAAPGITRTITWTLEGISASPPYYVRGGGTTPGVRFFGSPPVGHVGFYSVVVAFAVSPWAEFNLLTNTNCFAHIALL